ncbi:MAG: MBOAT family protein [Alphaproteobacteria bacterium]|nr:MBOAT family protein [Alphaproteobacteria bacterium]
MSFTTVYFAFFLTAVIFGYYAVSRENKYLFILLCNLFFYISWCNTFHDLLPIAFVTVVSWCYGRYVSDKRIKNKKVFFNVLTLICLFPLLYYKYHNFLADNVFGLTGLIISNRNPVAPVGISFFTFQAISYVVDVYRGNATSEKNLFRYAAFVTFFPTVTSGPIERAGHLIPQFSGEKTAKIDWQNIKNGLILFFYGVFIKLVLSNRLSIVVDTVFQDYERYNGVALFVSSIFYTLQIYCDFSAYSLMALGVARTLNLDVFENFKAPYFSESIQEFWRRWHISLSLWLRDYVYISLGGNRCSVLRKDFNILVTFLVSGWWHGASWTFVFWGLLHGLYQVIGIHTKEMRRKFVEAFEIKTDCFSAHFWRKLFIFMCVSTAWIFFRAETITDAFGYIGQMVSTFSMIDVMNFKFDTVGLKSPEANILFVYLILFILLDYIKYKTDKNADTLIAEQDYIFQFCFLFFLFMSVFVFGMYGPEFNAQDFIYIRF